MNQCKSVVDFYKKLASAYLISSQEEKSFEENKMKKDLETFSNLFSSLSELEVYKKHLRTELGIVSDNSFNIFTSIAEYYWYENLHSDILKNILDPYTPGMGNSQFLRCFLELIGINPESFNYKNASLERESERVDLLIYDENSAIIIENKINNACDQENQLPRYYKKITDPNGEYQKEVIKIVYLTLTNKKNPTFDYTGEYKKYKNDIEKRLVHVSAVNLPQNKFAAKRTLAANNGFLEQLLKIAKEESKKSDDYVTMVYLQHYSQLLNYLGENEIMSETNEKIAKLMFETEDSSEMAKDIVDIYNNKYVYLGTACIKDIIDENSCYEKINDGIIGKKLSDGTYSYFAVEADTSNRVFSYGFYNPNGDWTVKKQESLAKKIKSTDAQQGNEWVFKYLSFNNLETEKKLQKLTVSKMKAFIIGLIDSLAK